MSLAVPECQGVPRRPCLIIWLGGLAVRSSISDPVLRLALPWMRCPRFLRQRAGDTAPGKGGRGSLMLMHREYCSLLMLCPGMWEMLGFFRHKHVCMCVRACLCVTVCVFGGRFLTLRGVPFVGSARLMRCTLKLHLSYSELLWLGCGNALTPERMRVTARTREKEMVASLDSKWIFCKASC